MLVFAGILFGCVGCASTDEARVLDFQWKSVTDYRVSQAEKRLDALEQPTARLTQDVAGSAVKSAVSNASLQFSDSDLVPLGEDSSFAFDDVDKDNAEGFEAKGELETPVHADPASERVEKSTPVESVDTYVDREIPYAAPRGPVTYGMPRTSGYREETRYKTVRRVVEERVPVTVKIPVQKRAVYETVTESYQVPQTRTVCVSETRQRSKTVMVPKTIVENYQVQVPKQVTEMVTRTRSRQIQVGEEEVPVSVASMVRTSEPFESYTSSVSYPEPVGFPAYDASPVITAETLELSASPVIAPVRTRVQNRKAGAEVTRLLNEAAMPVPTVQVRASIVRPTGDFNSFPAASNCADGNCSLNFSSAAPSCANGNCPVNYSSTARPAASIGTARPSLSSQIKNRVPLFGRRGR